MSLSTLAIVDRARTLPKPPINRGIVATAILWLFAIAVATTLGSTSSAYALCTLPLAIHLLVRALQGQEPLRPSVGSVAAATYFLFFGSGLTQFLIERETLTFGVVGRVPLEQILPALFGTAMIATAIVVGSAFVRTDTKVSRSDPPSISISLTGDALVLLALSGAGMTIASYGGVEAATSALLLHDRQTGLASAGEIGSSLWGVFALPAACVSGASMLGWNLSKARRALSATECLLVVGIAVGIFGSRLTMILTIVSLWFTYEKFFRRVVPVKYLAGVASIFVLASVLVLNTRAVVQNTTNQASFWDTLGYGIFDVTAASSLSRNSLSSEFADPSRALTALSTALPGSGARALEISDARLDVIVARAIGNTVHAETTGLPPSLFTAIWIPFGIIWGCLLAATVALVLSSVHRVLSKSSRNAAYLFIGLFGAFVFNTLKGGDLLLDLGSEISRWGYVLMIYAVVSWTFSPRVGQNRSKVT